MFLPSPGFKEGNFDTMDGILISMDGMGSSMDGILISASAIPHHRESLPPGKDKNHTGLSELFKQQEQEPR